MNSAEENVGTSFINKAEASKAILIVIRILMASDIEALGIVVMSAYKAQAKYFVSLRGRQTTSTNEACLIVSMEIIRRLGKVRFSTVDAFQGSECALIITTMCRPKTVGHTKGPA